MSEDRVKKGANKYAKIKDIRKIMNEIKNDPLLKRLEMTNSQLPSNLSVNDFVEARAHEINHFTEYINNRPGTKLTHQMLPRSLRRRAMSHNYFRIPLRIRYKSYKEFEPTLKAVENNKEAAEEKKNQEGFRVRSWNQKPKRAKTRKHKRSTKSLLNAYHERILRGGQWLETHIWHSKRFHMQSLWGFKVPKRNHEKLKRATYRYTQHSSWMIDLSYYVTLKIEAQEKQILINILSKIGCFKDINSNIKNIKLDFNKLYLFKFVYQSKLESTQQLIAPCSIMYLSETWWILNFHPAAFEEISLILWEFQQITVNKIWLNKFEITGTESIKSLYSVLKPLLTSDSQREFFDEILLPNYTSFASFRDSKAVFVSIKNPNWDFRMNERVFKYQESGFAEQNMKKLSSDGLYQVDNSWKIPNQLIMKDRQENILKSYIDSIKIEPNKQSTNIDSFSILQQNQDLYINLNKKFGSEIVSSEEQRVAFISNINDHWVPLDDVREEIIMETSRSNYTHRKKHHNYADLIANVKNKKLQESMSFQKENEDNDDLMEEEKKTPSDKIKDKMEEIELLDKNQDNQNINQLNKKNVKLKEKQRDEIILMLVYSKSKNGFGDSIQIFIESGYSLGLLRRFSYAGTKIIGLDEYKLLHIEREQLIYPFDYPQTKAYHKIANENGKQSLIELYWRKPPSKRMNFAKINSPFPFKSNWKIFDEEMVNILVS